MTSTGSTYLVLGATFSALAAVAHLAIILGGPSWYRFFGAGEGMARLAASGSWYPAFITLAIAAVLALWAVYACSGAGFLPKLPLLRTALVAITSIYLLRGLAGVFLAAFSPGQNGVAFWLWSSAICLAIGALHAIGLVKRWADMGGGQG